MHVAERQAMLLTFWKDLRRKSCLLGSLKVRFPSSPRIALELYAVLSWSLVCWAGSERFASSRFQLRCRRQRGLDSYLSVWENSALLGKLGSLSVTCRTWDAMQEATHFAVLALCTHSSWWLLFDTISGKLFSLPRNFGFVFRDQ